MCHDLIDSPPILGHKFYETLPAGNRNRISFDLCGICLKSHLFSRVFELCSGIRDDIKESQYGVKQIVTAIYIRDSPSVPNTA